MRRKDVTLIWEHGGHKLTYEPFRKDAHYYLTVKNETDKDRTVAIKPGQLHSLKGLIEQAEADTASALEWEARTLAGGDGS